MVTAGRCASAGDPGASWARLANPLCSGETLYYGAIDSGVRATENRLSGLPRRCQSFLHRKSLFL